MKPQPARPALKPLITFTPPHLGWPLVVIGLALTLAGCSRLPRLDEVLPDRRTEYRKSESLPDLEVPPDLTTDRIQDSLAVPEIGDDGIASYSTYQERVSARKQTREALQADADSVAQLADEQVVFVPSNTEGAFEALRSFWADKNVPLDLDDTELGVLETAWLENTSGDSRERFKVFAEAGADGKSTVLYVSREAQARSGPEDPVGWAPSSPDGARLASFANALREHFGLSTQTDGLASGGDPAGTTGSGLAVAASAGAATAPAELFSAGEGRVFLSVPQDFAVVWARLESAITGAGLKVVDADRSRGSFRIELPAEDRVESERGILSRLAFWRDRGEEDLGEREISVTGVGAKTEVVILDGGGKWDTSPVASRILTDLLGRLNGA